MRKDKGTDSTLPKSTADPFESTSQVLDTSNWKNADEAKNDPFLGGQLSPELNLFDHILP